MSGGFDLVLGKLYNDFWFNASEPQHRAASCSKCGERATIHSLEKIVLAFGNMTVKSCVVHTCPCCLNEEIVKFHEPAPKKVTKKNLVSLFAKLPKSIQQQLLTGGKK